MSKTSDSGSLRGFRIFLSGLILLSGLCLMAACLGICLSGDQPFTPESVAAAFDAISLPLFLCCGAIAAAFVLRIPAPKSGASRPVSMAKTSRPRMTLLRNVVLAASILLLILGICTGGTADVLTKAVNICTECVGLG